MDYEKKYKEALQRAKDFKDGIVHHALEPGESIVGWIFPELRESDDEMIINQLITLVNSAGEVLFIPTNKEELVAWLNKCKESLHISETCKENADSFTSEDERIRKYLVEELKAAKSVGELKFTIPQPTREECIAYLEKQKDDRMKPIYDARESFESALKKAWNDYHNGYENVDKLEDDYVECAHAKGFREGFLYGLEKQKEQKPAEWNEEDEKHINLILRVLDIQQCWDGATGKKFNPYQGEIDWLKSLRPRPSWKPSEEEMKALDVACSGKLWYGEIYLNGLRRIREQLKKL